LGGFAAVAGGLWLVAGGFAFNHQTQFAGLGRLRRRGWWFVAGGWWFCFLTIKPNSRALGGFAAVAGGLWLVAGGFVFLTIKPNSRLRIRQPLSGPDRPRREIFLDSNA
jgi:hypothetical protein